PAGCAGANVPRRVSGTAAGRASDSKTQVEPLLSRLGCNAGGCHGKASGQNGFRLSLFGFDSGFDYEAIAREARGRRIFPAAPAQSLMLLKATGQVPHGGGRRMSADGEEYRLVRRWIEAGAPASAPNTPGVVRLHVTPGDRTLRPGQSQQLAVVAEYRRPHAPREGGPHAEREVYYRDVTRQAEYFTNL